jgi:hypothetical protein
MTKEDNDSCFHAYDRLMSARAYVRSAQQYAAETSDRDLDLELDRMVNKIDKLMEVISDKMESPINYFCVPSPRIK